jgi:DNA mismatch repair protein MutS
MAGKSTYLRQMGLIVLLAQIGSCVPADHAVVGLCDRIFTRVGASDRLAKGQSTFMVEMIETANILRHATPGSLVLLDEIGRGTSTYDGLSLAWSIVEALHQDSQRAARTLFATHYHELTQLETKLERLRNVQVKVRETEGQVVFLRKVIEGACDSSYGIQVARMAGVPEPVVQRAGEILRDLEGGKLPGSTNRRTREKPASSQVDLFSAPSDPVIVENPLHKEAYETLLEMDLNQMTPLEVLFKVGEWQKSTRKKPNN